MFRKFLSDRRGNFALITAIAMLPMILAIGFAIDGARYYKARSHLQDAVDTASLAVAASEEQDTRVLRTMAEEFIRSNLDERTIDNVNFDWFTSTPEEINAGVHGSITTTFMQLANVKTMPVSVSTVAKRAPKQIVEIALVLDNTYSMSAPDAKTGETRIETLRKASKSLVETLLPTDEPGPLSIALVPYADHVNVGIENKNQNWLALDGVERTETGGGDRVCGPKVENGTETYCKKYSTKTCTSIVDGITVTKDCNDQCIEQGTRTAYTQTCTGKDPYTNTYK
ncbi:MAG: pilus assembly protein, partial [Sphingomonadales bacterium]